MDTNLITPLVLSGCLAGAVNFFANYINLPFTKPKDSFVEDPLKLKDVWWIALIGYLITGIAGSFLTLVINAIVGGLKGLDLVTDIHGITNPQDPNYIYILFGYGLIFGYSTTRLLMSLVDSIIKKVSSVEERLKILETQKEKLESKQSINNVELFIARPNWNSVYEGYPTTDGKKDDLPAADVFTSILGSKYDTKTFKNACATRVSLGLLNAGIILTKPDFLVQVGKFKGKGFIASALNLKNCLSQPTYFGDADIIINNPSSLDEVQNRIKSKNGIYIIIGGFGPGVSGHSTLWVGSENNVIGGHNYINNEAVIYFWELA